MFKKQVEMCDEIKAVPPQTELLSSLSYLNTQQPSKRQTHCSLSPSHEHSSLAHSLGDSENFYSKISDIPYGHFVLVKNSIVISDNHNVNYLSKNILLYKQYILYDIVILSTTHKDLEDLWIIGCGEASNGSWFFFSGYIQQTYDEFCFLISVFSS